MESKFLNELNKYETKMSELDKKAGYTIVTKKIFEQETNEDEIAVLAMISLLSHKEVVDNEIKIMAFKTQQILDLLNVDVKRNAYKIVNKIDSAIQSLIEKGVLRKRKESELRYYLTQIIDEKGFYQLGCDEIEDITDKDITVSNKIKVVAEYSSVCSKIFATKNFDNAQRFVNYESLSTIAKRRGAERRSIAKSIQYLINIKVLAFYKIARKGEIETKYILSRYCHRAMLKQYVKQEIAKGNYYLIAKDAISNDFDFDFEIVKAEDSQKSQEQELHSELQRIAEVLNVKTFNKKYINKFNQILKNNDEEIVHNTINYLLSDKYFRDLSKEEDVNKYMNTAFKQFNKFLKKGREKKQKDDLTNNILSINRNSKIKVDCDSDDDDAVSIKEVAYQKKGGIVADTSRVDELIRLELEKEDEFNFDEMFV